MFRRTPRSPRLTGWLRLLALLLVALAATSAAAQNAGKRDAAATKKIDEAINEHYLATNFDKAEELITGVIKACEDQCSKPVLARAWMYVGIVRGSGRGDQAGAKAAFQTAIGLDSGVKLDDAIASPETKTTFAEVGGSGGAAGGGSGGGDGGGGGTTTKPPKGEDDVGNMKCTPESRTIQTRYPVPISCVTDEEATKAELKYKAFGEEKWETVKMKKKGDFFQAEIPCLATQQAGALKIYVRAKDSSGDTVDSWGSKKQPIEFTIVEEEQEDEPAFPDKDPPKRCQEQISDCGQCPPGMEDSPMCRKACKGGGGGDGATCGKGQWGDGCDGDADCDCALACTNGTCEERQSCESDADCPDGVACAGGKCGGTGDAAGGGPAKKLWFGVHVGWDLALVAGEDVCSQKSQAESGFACFDSANEQQYLGDPQPGVANKIAGGFAPGTQRLMISGEYLITPNITVGARVGYAFGGGPKAGTATFLPFHFEPRATYYIGADPLAQAGLRPYVHLGGGVAQVDAKLDVNLVDCGVGASDPNSPTNVANGGASYACVTNGTIQPGVAGETRSLDAYKKLGQSFVAAGGGGQYAFSPTTALQLNLNFMYMLPTTGMVFEPSLGVVMGF
ncbi:MAG: hypothetical protein IT376_06885 [Polyangiaceae bacterium]|nr:hypothetical protein [Polyangiaceae bacterium]